jgi:hypothetical protein
MPLAKRSNNLINSQSAGIKWPNYSYQDHITLVSLNPRMPSSIIQSLCCVWDCSISIDNVRIVNLVGLNWLADLVVSQRGLGFFQPLHAEASWDVIYTMIIHLQRFTFQVAIQTVNLETKYEFVICRI